MQVPKASTQMVLSSRAILIALRVTATILLLAPLVLMLLSDTVFFWMRSSKGFFYQPVIVASLGALEYYHRRGTASKTAIMVAVAVAVALLVIGWVFGLPLAFGVPVALGAALSVFLLSRKQNRLQQPSEN